MAVQLNPYLGFKNNARAAMEFYHSVFGGKLEVRTFGDFGAAQDPGETDLVMHAELNGETGIKFYGSDTPARIEYKPGTNISMSLSGESSDEAEMQAYFEKLSAGGTVTQPLEKAQWGDTFGMCIDKFGVTWLVNISAPK